MKRAIIICILILSLLFNVGFYNENDDEIKRTINELNELRTILSLPSILINESLNNAAHNHNKYMYYNESFSYIEESGNSYYRGRYPADRASYFLYDNLYICELSNNNNSTYTEGIVDFTNNPYSRIALLDPVYTDIGMNGFEGLYTYVLGGENRNEKSIIYPYNNQTQVPINWVNHYMIDPYNDLEVDSTDCGLPITYTLYSDTKKVQTVDIVDISITNMNTNIKISEEKIKVKLPENDRYLKNSIIILPLEKYNYNTTYQANINIVLNYDDFSSQPVKETVIFHTETEDEKSNNSITSLTLLTRAKATEEIVKAVGYTLLEPFEIKFNDVDVKSVCAKYIYTAYINGIITGTTPETFGPDLNITREQAYKILISAYESERGDIIYLDERPIEDINDVSSWAVESIRKANEIGILTIDNSENLLYPQEYVSENEFIEIINKFKESIKPIKVTNSI